MAGHPPYHVNVIKQEPIKFDRLLDQTKMRDYEDKRVTPSKRVTSPRWGPPPPCKQALIVV